jgi:Domain of unknown function (DUF4349)
MTATRRSARRLGTARTITTALVATLLLGSCSGGGDDGGLSSDDAQGGAGSDAAALAPEADAPGERSSGSGGDRATLLGPTYEIKQGQIELESTNVAAVGDKLYTLAARVRGEVADEQTRSDITGRQTQTTMLLLVPVETFDDAMREIPGYGTLRSRALSIEDVTTQVTDLEVRVENARESVAQLRALFQRATKLGEVILLESEISTRQADLESLLAQQRVLTEQTAMSQITVTVVQTPDRGPGTDPDDEDRAGFLSGLKQGWDALIAFVLTIGHAVGAALPITVLLLGVYLVLRPTLRRIRPTWWRPSPSE